MKARKYGNVRPTYKGVRFDSGLEMARFIFLCDQEKKGRIEGLRRQVKFELVPAQYCKVLKVKRTRKGEELVPQDRLAERAVNYIADFVYDIRNDEGQGFTVVEDAKGLRTDAYIIKRKLMLYVHGIAVREIRNAADPVGQ